MQADIFRRQTLALLWSAAALGLAPSSARAKTRRVWRVGLDKDFSSPREAALVARDGDEILIDPGFYEGGQVVWRASNLLIRAGEEGLVRIDANTSGAPLWELEGQAITIRGILFGTLGPGMSSASALHIKAGSATLERCGFIGLAATLRAGTAHLGTLLFRECGLVRCGSAEHASLSAGDAAHLEMHGCWIVGTHAGPLVISTGGSLRLVSSRLIQLGSSAEWPMIECPYAESVSVRGCVLSSASLEDSTPAPLFALGDRLMQERSYQTLELLHNTMISRLSAMPLLRTHQALKTLTGWANVMIGVDTNVDPSMSRTRWWGENLSVSPSTLPSASLDWQDARLPARLGARLVRKNMGTGVASLRWSPLIDLPSYQGPNQGRIDALRPVPLAAGHVPLIGARQTLLD